MLGFHWRYDWWFHLSGCIFLHLGEMLVPSMALWMYLVLSAWSCGAIIIPSVSFLSSPLWNRWQITLLDRSLVCLRNWPCMGLFAIFPSGTLMFSPCILSGLHLLWSSLLPMHFLAIHLCLSSGIVTETSSLHWCILLTWVGLSLLHCMVSIAYLQLILRAVLGTCLVLFWPFCPYCGVLISSNQLCLHCTWLLVLPMCSWLS